MRAKIPRGQAMQKLLRSTIVVIDDDVQVLKSLCFLLETEGYPVLTFDSADALLANIDLPEPACFVVDYRMPGMNGLELLLRIREKYPQIPALIITGYPDLTIEERAASVGINVIRKPHLDEGLLQGIHDVLARAKH